LQRRFILWRTFGETTFAEIAICAFGGDIGFSFLGLDVGGAEAGHICIFIISVARVGSSAIND
jgi:hypothetical protein